MTITVIPKGGSISIVGKANEHGLSGNKVHIGAGWDSQADLDLIVLALADGQVVALAYQSRDPNTRAFTGVQLAGDNRTGLGNNAGDEDESGEIDLTKLAPDITKLMVCLFAYEGGDLSSVKDPFVRICAGVGADAPELGRYLIADKAFRGDTMLVAATLNKGSSGWDFHADSELIAIGQGAAGLQRFIELDFSDNARLSLAQQAKARV